jgi:tetratricopeptide (TPR) repeat protein
MEIGSQHLNLVLNLFLSMTKLRLIPLGIVLLLFGCTTTKKKNADIGWLKKNYHNLTSKYNYWFNADELLHLTMVDLEAQHKDNYHQLLELYPYAAVNPSGALNNLDNVIKKSATAIVLHRVSDFTDDCYTMMGQAQYLKRDYETAEATFRFIREKYNPTTKSKLKSSKDKKNVKKKKKKASPKKKKKKKKASSSKSAAKDVKDGSDKSVAGGKKAQKAEPLLITENPYERFLQRTAAYPLAMIWYGRTLTERQKYEEADFLYRSLEQDPYFPSELRKDLYTAQAYLFIKQKRYAQAIAPLERAVQNSPRKRERARLAYILSQLYERSNQPEKAYNALEIALSSNPTYEMEFNARLRQVQAGYAYKRFSAGEAIRQLERMIRDEKNAEYKDQIYFAIAGIQLREKQRDEAVVTLKQALANATAGTYIRSEAYLLLADLYFEAEDYISAKKYFDSTLTVLPADDPRFARAQRYADNLTEIARLITRIAENDSIVRLYYMSPEERLAFVKRLRQQREEEAKQASAGQDSPATSSAAPPTAPIAGQRSSFYFYNDAFLKKGKKDFTKIWGNRKLEDNWRRSNRSQTAGVTDVTGIAKTETAAAGEPEDLKEWLQGIPQSEEELSVLHASTYEAMFNLGVLYREKLENNLRCSGTLEELQRRYPDLTKHQIETWYYCYLAFTDLGNRPRAKYYYDLLVAHHPNSPYTRVLTDPDFVNLAREREKEAMRYYDQAYDLFKQGNYSAALDRCKKAPERYGTTHPLIPKFLLLEALCTGSLQGQAAYCQALKEVVARFPESAEATRAKEIARVVSCEGYEGVSAASPVSTTSTFAEEAFTPDDDKLHYFLVVLYGNDIPLDDIKVAVSDYNREYHRLEQLRLSNIFLGTDINTPILVIRKFDNKEQAMRYYHEVKDRKEFLGETAKKTYNKEFFPITQENYRRVLKNKSLDGYREFFAQHYLK